MAPIETQTSSEGMTGRRSALATVALWLAAGIAIAGVLAMVLSHAPPRLRLIGLLAGIQGAFCGWLASLVGTRLRMRNPLAALLGGAVFGSGSVALTTVLWWQAHADQLTKNFKQTKGAAMALAMSNQAPQSSDPKTQRQLEEYQSALKLALAPPDTSLSAYLQFRISSLADSRAGGQMLFGFELLVAGILCGWLARAGAARPFCENCAEWIRPVRRCEFAGDDAVEVAALIGREVSSTTRVAVTLSQCRCEGRRPDVLFVLESPDGHSVRLSSTDSESPIVLNEQAYDELVERIDVAQGLR